MEEEMRYTKYAIKSRILSKNRIGDLSIEQNMNKDRSSEVLPVKFLIYI